MDGRAEELSRKNQQQRWFTPTELTTVPTFEIPFQKKDDTPALSDRKKCQNVCHFKAF